MWAFMKTLESHTVWEYRAGTGQNRLEINPRHWTQMSADPANNLTEISGVVRYSNPTAACHQET